ncbi:uncharacterized protein LOC141668424 isoform X2 [Apium graveolens]|uniref:uncharacterized protein LOC141668424 isoform X2 n=1 Tax=Apium graveolens TaxID=4045 RepID=UPI003D7B6FAD
MASARHQSYANAVSGDHSHRPTNTTTQVSDSDPLSSNTDDVSSINVNMHPLFLHNNDQPGMILISKKLTGSDNFASWKRSLQIALSAKNKLVILTGDFVAPAVDSSLFPHWKRVNDMVITWILNTVSDDISNSMNYMDSAIDVWNALNDRFSIVSGHKFYETQKELFKLEQGNDSIEFYFHKLKGLWDELRALEPVVKCTCGATKNWEEQLEKKRLIQFLMGLHTSYTTARGNLLMMNPWPSVNQAYMLLKQEERQRQVHTTSSPLAMMVSLPKQHFQHQNKPSSSGSLECSYCHGKNHTRDKCFKLIGYPLDHPYHPNNKGKKRPFNKPTGVFSNPQTSQPHKSDHAMHISTSSGSSDSSSSLHPTAASESSSNLNSQMAVLQQQMNTLMQCFFKNGTGPQSSVSSIPFAYGHNVAGPVPDQSQTSPQILGKLDGGLYQLQNQPGNKYK